MSGTPVGRSSNRTHALAAASVSTDMVATLTVNAASIAFFHSVFHIARSPRLRFRGVLGLPS